jgi:uncharacterized protein
MRALFDISILLALLDQDHIHHERARSWWARQRHHGWASCPLSQNGFVRIISQKTYARSKPIGEAFAMMQRATTRPDHQFWPDDLSLLDTTLIDHSRALSPRHLTDVYLLALAVKHGGRLVTLDTGIALSAARGAKKQQLVVV